MKILQKRISYKTAGALLFILVFFALGATFLILSASENKDSSVPTPTATKSANTKESTASSQPTTKKTTDKSNDSTSNSDGDTSSGSSGGTGNTTVEDDPPPPTPPPPPPPPPSSNIVTITDSGFSPTTITINAGETVRWENDHSVSHWPASDPHPEHTDYFGFDSFGIAAGSSWSFKFTEVGSWNYHDHNIPARKGIVIVQ